MVFQEKSGKKAILILSRNCGKVRPEARSNSETMAGLTMAATTKVAMPIKIMNKVRMSGMVGSVLMVKRR